MSDVREALVKARELIVSPESWAGSAEEAFSPSPRKRCALQAISAIGWASTESLGRAVCQLLKACEGAEKIDIAHFNDTHTHAEVLAAFDRAIAAASAALTQQEKENRNA